MKTASQKKGFTLIELMVVIVIIGILAAIAIPKLFGMSAKAKASEVGPAAGTWSKMQQAYLAETGKVGGSQQIAYKLPGTAPTAASSPSANFTYYVAVTLADAATEANWSAQPVAALNDCLATNTWTATFDKETASVTSAITGSNAAECAALTPNFTKLQ